jgi:curved DNA-binding protein CbpA
MSEAGYINYFEILGLGEDANPGEVRNTYRKKMKALRDSVTDTIPEDRRAQFILDMAKLNAAVFILRDQAKRAAYAQERQALIDLEKRWTDQAAKSSDPESTDALRREFDARARSFLSKYVEETMLEAGQDKDVAELSGWNIFYARYALKLLRHYRHLLYHDILERLPFHVVTQPSIDWAERRRTVAAILQTAGR